MHAISGPVGMWLVEQCWAMKGIWGARMSCDAALHRAHRSAMCRYGYQTAEYYTYVDQPVRPGQHPPGDLCGRYELHGQRPDLDPGLQLLQIRSQGAACSLCTMPRLCNPCSDCWGSACTLVPEAIASSPVDGLLLQETSPSASGSGSTAAVSPRPELHQQSKQQQ